MDFNFPPKEGSGVAKLIPHVNPECVDLIVKLLMYNPDERLSARQVRARARVCVGVCGRLDGGGWMAVGVGMGVIVVAPGGLGVGSRWGAMGWARGWGLWD